MTVSADERPRTTWIIAAAALLIGLVVQATGWLRPLDAALLDAQTRMQQRQVDTDAALVEIDARSLRELGPWPWPRTYHAEVIEALTRAGAARIVVDIDFSSPSQPDADRRLSEAVSQAGGRVLLPTFWQRTSVTADSLILSEPMHGLREHAQLGSVNLAPGLDGRVREVADLTPNGYSLDNAPFAFVLNPGHARDRQELIDFRISPYSFPTLSFATVLKDPASAALLQGRTVFVGSTAMEMGDLVSVPVHGSLPGVLVQMLAYETLRAHPLRAVPPLLAWLAVVAAAVLTTLIGRRMRWTLLASLALISACALLGIAVLAYALADVWWMPMAAIVASFAAAAGLLLSRLQGESLKALRYWISFRRQGALLREVVGQSTEAILTLDDAGRVLTANPMAERMLGRDAAALTGVALAELVPGFAGLLDDRSTQPAAREVMLELAAAEPLIVDITLTEIHVEGERILSVRMRDITLQKTRERELHYHATHDALTRLPNRLALAERLSTAFTSESGVPQRGALLLMDLDGFKEVNDSLGHSMGDMVLQEIAARFVKLLPPGGFVARLGGDEFALLLPRDDDTGEVQWVCRAFLASASEPVPVRGVPVSLGVSGGMVLWPEHATDGDTLLQKGDFALYAAKRRHSVLETYEPAAEPNTSRRIEMLTLLRKAVREEELYMVYQPKVHLQSGSVSGVEALCRWLSPQLGEVSPGEFMPLAEATEIITPLTRWTLERGMRDCARWQADGRDLSLAINLSARHLQSSRLVDDVAELLQSSGLPARALELEITESALMSDPERAFAVLQGLRELGVALSIDDFGTGYSSLSYLQRLRVDRLKIDRSFIQNLASDAGSRAIVASTIQLAHALSLQVVAEGIENSAQHDILCSLGCDYGQGYLYGRAMRVEALGAWIEDRRQRPAAAGRDASAAGLAEGLHPIDVARLLGGGDAHAGVAKAGIHDVGAVARAG